MVPHFAPWCPVLPLGAPFCPLVPRFAPWCPILPFWCPRWSEKWCPILPLLRSSHFRFCRTPWRIRKGAKWGTTFGYQFEHHFPVPKQNGSPRGKMGHQGAKRGTKGQNGAPKGKMGHQGHNGAPKGKAGRDKANRDTKRQSGAPRCKSRHQKEKRCTWRGIIPRNNI